MRSIPGPQVGWQGDFEGSLSSRCWMGCVVYELTRLAGRPPTGIRPPSSFRWKQDTVVALVLVVVCVGGPAFRRLTAPLRCAGIRIACVSTTQADIERMLLLLTCMRLSAFSARVAASRSSATRPQIRYFRCGFTRSRGKLLRFVQSHCLPPTKRALTSLVKPRDCHVILPAVIDRALLQSTAPFAA